MAEHDVESHPTHRPEGACAGRLGDSEPLNRLALQMSSGGVLEQSSDDFVSSDSELNAEALLLALTPPVLNNGRQSPRTANLP